MIPKEKPAPDALATDDLNGTETHSGRFFAWYLVALLTVIAAFDYADRTAIAAALPLLRSELHMSPFVEGVTGSAFFWIYALCSPFSGYIADKLSRTKIIVWSCFLWSLVMVASGLVRTSWQMVAVRAALGVAECAYVPAAVGLTAFYHRGKTRASALGIQLAGYNMGVVLGAVFVGHFGEHWGWRPSFWALGLGGILFALIAKITLPADDRRETKDEKHSIKFLAAVRALLAVPTFNIILLESTIISGGVWIFLFWLPLYFKDSFGLTLAAAGVAGTLGLQTAATVASLAGGYISDRVAHHRLKRRMLLQIFCFGCGIPLLIPFLGRPFLAVASAAIFGFAFFRTLGSTTDNAIMCDVLSESVWSTGVGLTNASNSIANALFVLLTGYLEPHFGLGSIFGSLWVTVAVAAGLVFVGYRYYLASDLARAAQGRAPSNRQTINLTLG